MGKRKKGQPVSGWLVLDKPHGMSSTQALGRVRWLLDAQKGGHGGTLDPLATGVLPLAFGEATKTLPFVLDKSKTYQFEVTFGTATTTADVEGEVTETSAHIPAQQDIEAILRQFTGDIEQTPPAYSAIKIDGERAYKKARKGEEVEMQARKVTIYGLKMLSCGAKTATFEAEVSKGTYIRSLGVDIARASGSCGHITKLRRVLVGNMDIQNAIPLEEVEKKVANSGGKGHIPPNLLFETDWVLDDILACQVSAADADRLKHGQSIALPDAPQGLVRAKSEAGELISLLEVAADGSTIIVRNFNMNDIA